MTGQGDYRLPAMTAGRQRAGAALLGWLEDERAPRLCVVGGSPGCGKSHLLAWLYRATSVPGTPVTRRLHAFVPVDELTVPSVVFALADLLGVAACTPAELVAAVAADPRRTVLAVAGLDAAGTPTVPGVAARPHEGRLIATRILDPLLELPHVRVLVEGSGYAHGVFEQVDAPAVLDLDEPTWTDPVRFGRWYDGLVAASAFASPFTATDVYPHPGAARLAACVDGTRPASAPVASSDTAARVLRAWWDSIPEGTRPVVAALYGLGTPVNAAQWETAYATVSGADPATIALAVGRAALQVPSTGGREPTWALREHALAAYVAAHSPEATDPTRPARVHAALRRLADGGAAGMREVYRLGEERLTAILGHSIRVGDVAGLVADPVVQALARPHAVITALAASGQWDDDARAAFRGAAPALVGERDPAVRASTARVHRLGRVPADARRLDAHAAVTGWNAEWALWHDAHATGADPWPGPVHAATAGRGRFAGRVLLADPAGTVRVLDAATGAVTGRLTGLDHGPLADIANAAGGRLALVDAWGGVDVVAAAEADPERRLDDALERLIDAAEGTPAAVCVFPAAMLGDSEGSVSWFGELPYPAGPDAPPRGVFTVPQHHGPVSALVGLDLGTGPPLLISGGRDGHVRLWSPGTTPMVEALDARGAPVTALAADHTERGTVVAVAWADGLVRLRRLDDERVMDLRLGAPVRGIAICADGRLVLGTRLGVVGIRLTDKAADTTSPDTVPPDTTPAEHASPGSVPPHG